MRFFLHFGVNPGPTGIADVLFSLGNVRQGLRLCSPCAEQIGLEDCEISVNMVIAPIKMSAIRSRSMPVFCERLVDSGLISPKHPAALKTNRGCAVLVRRGHWKSSVRESSFNVPRRLLPPAILNRVSLECRNRHTDRAPYFADLSGIPLLIIRLRTFQTSVS